ncbi:MAG: Na+ dependent nucleoside transporter N-terminal domain-containing protein, partial [Bacteroidota bacterium]
MSLLNTLHGLVGMGVILGIAWLFSNNKRVVNWRLVGMGLSIQLVFGVLVIKGQQLGQFFSPFGWPKQLFQWIAEAFVIILGFTTEGAKFVFGNLAVSQGMEGSLGFFFAFQVLPTIIFFSS